MTTPANAADEEGNFALRGPGALDCARYIEEVEAGDSAEPVVFLAWAQGYLTRHNLTAEAVFDAVPVIGANDVATLLLRICRNEPQIGFVTAVDRLIEAAAGFAIAESSPIIEATHEGETVRLRQATLATLQSHLQGLELYQGGVDGIFGPGTARALIAYQESRDLAETGLPDLNTLAMVMAERFAAIARPSSEEPTTDDVADSEADAPTE